MILQPQDCQKKFGAPGDAKTQGKYMHVWIVPADLRKDMPCLPVKVFLNNEMELPLYMALRNLVARGLHHELKEFNGCYMMRKMRGLNATSLHSWGVAVDVNASTNVLGHQPMLSAGFVKCFTDVGFDWGGSWARKDGMHFQLSKI